VQRGAKNAIRAADVRSRIAASQQQQQQQWA